MARTGKTLSNEIILAGFSTQTLRSTIKFFTPNEQISFHINTKKQN